MARHRIWIGLIVVCVAAYAYLKWQQYLEKRACAQQLYEQAIVHEKDKRFRAEHAIHRLLCNVPTPVTDQQRSHACNRSGTLGTRLDTSYVATKAALEEYRTLNGHYPESLDPVLAQLPQTIREVAREFDYYRKRNSADPFAVSSNGEIIWTTGDSDIVLISGRYGTASFNLARRSKRTCAAPAP